MEGLQICLNRFILVMTLQVSNANPLMPRGTPRDWSTGFCACTDDVPVCKYIQSSMYV